MISSIVYRDLLAWLQEEECVICLAARADHVLKHDNGMSHKCVCGDCALPYRDASASRRAAGARQAHFMLCPLCRQPW